MQGENSSDVFSSLRMFRISSFSTNIQFNFDDNLFKRSYNEVHLSTLTFLCPGCSSPEIIIHRKRKLLDKQLFVRCQVILLIEKYHRLLVINRLNAAIRQWTISIFDQNAVACDPPGP